MNSIGTIGNRGGFIGRLTNWLKNRARARNLYSASANIRLEAAPKPQLLLDLEGLRKQLRRAIWLKMLVAQVLLGPGPCKQRDTAGHLRP